MSDEYKDLLRRVKLRIDSIHYLDDISIEGFIKYAYEELGLGEEPIRFSRIDIEDSLTSTIEHVRQIKEIKSCLSQLKELRSSLTQAWEDIIKIYNRLDDVEEKIND